MKGKRKEAARLLRWYPPAWRDRYGEELVVLMQDSSDGRPPNSALRLSTVWAGLRERAHEAGVIGIQRSPAEQVRAGSILVLCAWSAFVVAGASFSKMAEHFSQAVPVAARLSPQIAFDVVAALGVTGIGLVALGAVVALPAFVRFLRTGGGPSIRRHVLRAGVLTGVTVASLASLSVSAMHLTPTQRNGGSDLYSAAFIASAVLVAGTVAQWTTAGVAGALRIELTRPALHLEALLAIALAGTMALITTATALWWGEMAQIAPWFLGGMETGTRATPFNLQLALTMALMLTATLVAIYGLVRIVRSWEVLAPA